MQEDTTQSPADDGRGFGTEELPMSNGATA